MLVIIPDVHLKYKKVDKILDEWLNSNNTIVCLGDYFDDYGDSIQQTQETVDWLDAIIDTPGLITLIGNHDLSYCREVSRCRGWSHNKQQVINRITPKMIERLKFHYYTEINNKKFLLSHAGVVSQLMPKLEDIGDIDTWLNQEGEEARKRINTNLPHWFFQAGRYRGGPYPRGGLMWADWDELSVYEDINQIVGHTRDKTIRVKSTQFAKNYCIDCDLTKYAIIDNSGEIEFREI